MTIFKLQSSLAFVFIFFSCCNVACSFEILKQHVDEIDDHFVMNLEVRLDVDYQTAYRIMTDFDNISALNDTIKLSEHLVNNGRSHYVHIESEGCVLFYCKRVIQYLDVKEIGHGYIMASTDVKKSNLAFGSDFFHLLDEGETVRLQYSQDMQPGFWIPPLIGSWLVKKRLLKEAIKTARGIELRAHELQPMSESK